MTTDKAKLEIPKDLLPSDGRFGSGPSMVPKASLENLLAEAEKYMGNSHRKTNVKSLVARLQNGCKELFNLPTDWEILLGNGGTTFLWDAFTFGAIKEQSQHLCFGEFSKRFADAVANTPHLDNPDIIESELGTCPVPVTNENVDFYAFTQNETSTGVAAEIIRPDNTDALVGVDATSAAGAMNWSADQADIYYFSLQKSFAADGGLWVACCSKPALKRFEELHNARWCPVALNLHLAHENSLKQQILNTPAIATIYLAVQYVERVLENGGLSWAVNRSKAASDYLYDWAEKSDWANPFVKEEKERSPITATIILDDKIQSNDVIEIFEQNGIVDVNPYRKLNYNLLRFGLFPSRDVEDVEALCACLDFVASNL